MMQQLVSVIMPAYNAEKTIKESIDSVLSQTYDNWELLVINDKSKDNTLSMIKEYVKEDNRIKLIDLEVNQGVAGARNNGLSKAKGRFLAFLDSDDIWSPDKLEKQVRFMCDKKSHMSCTSYEVIDADSNRLNKLMNPQSKISYKTLLKGSRVGCLTVMVDLDEVDKKDLEMKKMGHEDYVTWLNIAKKYGDIDGLPINLAKYRVFEGSLSGNKKKAIMWQYKIYRDNENLSLPYSIYNMSHYAFNAVFKYTKID